MSVAAFVFVSAKGSPGVTTAAAALAGVATDGGASPAILVELDPSGGSVQVLCGRAVTPGLVDAAGRLRREPSPDAIRENVTEAPSGIRTLLAPAAGPVTQAVIAPVGDRWVGSVEPAAQEVFVDAGQWDGAQPTASRIAGAKLVVVVCRPTVAGVEHTRHILDRLRGVARAPMAALVIGRRPYEPEEIAGYLDLPLAGALAWDGRGTTNLWATGVSRHWLRSRLARSAAVTLAGLRSMIADRSSPVGGIQGAPMALDAATSPGSPPPPPPGTRPVPAPGPVPPPAPPAGFAPAPAPDGGPWHPRASSLETPR